jgi:hypothetical protein
MLALTFVATFLLPLRARPEDAPAEEARLEKVAA